MPRPDETPTRLAVINLVGLTRRFLDGRMPRLQAFAGGEGNVCRVIDPVIPAVTSTAQATYLTGKSPAEHGIVANGWYDRSRAEHLFWKQSDHLVAGPKLWEVARESRPGLTVARLFWWNNMFSSVDFSITPRPIYCADGKKVFDITAHPLEIRDAVKRALGPFPFRKFWGPDAGIGSSQWIAEAGKWIEREHFPDLNLIYLPHLDYNLQRFGPDHPEVDEDLAEIDAVAGGLIDYLTGRDVEVMVLSEYGITPVDRPIHLNRVFRQQGWLEIKDDLGRDTLELGSCEAFAIADHQVAHIYVPNEELRPQVARILSEVRGVEAVWDREEMERRGLAHERSGDLVAVADDRSWFTYYFWEDDDRAPDYARTVDIHRKPGYDPAELFFNLPAPLAKAKVLAKLVGKQLGMRTLMDVIPLDASLVRGSHGRRPEDEADWPVLIGRYGEGSTDAPMKAASVFDVLLRKLKG